MSRLPARTRRYFQKKKEIRELESNWIGNHLEDLDNGWLCSCGHWNDWDFHCTHCKSQPPWGCDCAFCNDYEEDEDFDPIYSAIYPQDMPITDPAEDEDYTGDPEEEGDGYLPF